MPITTPIAKLCDINIKIIVMNITILCFIGASFKRLNVRLSNVFNDNVINTEANTAIGIKPTIGPKITTHERRNKPVTNVANRSSTHFKIKF